MPSEVVKIKDYIIPKFYVDIASSSKEEFEVTLNMEANIMIPRDTEDGDCIIEIKLEYIDEDKKTILSVVLRGSAEVESSLEDEEKKQILREIAVPVFYKELRKFLSEISEKTKLDFPNIPLIDEIDI